MSTFSTPLYRRGDAGEREFIGVATADLSLADLQGYLAGLRIDSEGFGFLLTSGGTLIGAPLGRMISAPISEVIQSGDNIDLRGWSDTPGDGPHSAEVRCPRSDESCQLRLLPKTQNGSSWSVGVVYSEQALLQPLRDYELRVLVVGVLMLFVLPLAIILITRRLTRPLLGLAAASESIARGELDVPLPETPGDDEVSQLVRAFDSMRDDLGRYIRDVKSAAAQRSRMDSELSAARDIQMAMLPQGGQAELHCPPVDLWARVRPARAVGGDLYAFERTGDRLLISIGDVSDKGVPAALFMARAISLIQQWEVQPDVPPQIAMQQLNHSLSRDNENCMFLTLFMGVLNLKTLELQFASAGHCAPMLLRDGGAEIIAQNRGPALGLQEGLSFALNRLQLYADDRLALYTDGFDEAHNSNNQLLGEEALMTIMAAPDTLPLAEAGMSVFAETDRFTRGAPQSDDMTLMLLEVAGTRRQPLQAERGSLTIDASLPGEAISWLENQWQALGLDARGLHDLQLVLEEIVCNIRDHAQTGEQDSVALSLERFGDRVELECIDPGQAYNPLREAPRAALGKPVEETEIGGLGVHLITRLTEQQFYRREAGRNILRVRLLLPSADRESFSSNTED
jgi:sigma-B regulation protein RsbU (phosphoserine phosphatase)